MDPVDEIKQKIDIVDFIGGYIEIKKAGRNYKGLCPFHGEKTPSFMVSPELQIFKCFGCGEGGDIFSFHQKIEGTDFPQSLEHLAERAGVKLPKRTTDPERRRRKKLFEINDLSARFYHYLLAKHKIGEEALDYLKDKRKLSNKTIKEFNIGYAPRSWDSLLKYLLEKKYKEEDILSAGLIVPKRGGKGYIDKFRGRITFPLTDPSGKVVGFTARIMGEGEPKYLNTPETLIFHKSSFLFGLDKAKVSLKKEGAVFVEGQMDVITANQNGITNVLASSGTSLTVGQLKLLSRYTKDLTFAFDSDLAGLTAIHRAIDLAEKQEFHIKVVMIPKEYADLDEFILAKPKKVKSFLNEGIPAFDFFLVSALKRYNVDSPIGKKKAMGELVPIFGRITDPVLRDHYIKRISNELDVTESVVASLLSEPAGEKEYSFVKKEHPVSESPFSQKSPEEYIIALILNAPLDSTQTVLYKLSQKDFTNPQLQEVFADLKKYMLGRKRKFEIKHFTKRFGQDLKPLVDELYLWDLEHLGGEEEKISKELESAFNLIKKKTYKRQLKELSNQIKQAEMENNKKLLRELSEQFKELSEKLI